MRSSGTPVAVTKVAGQLLRPRPVPSLRSASAHRCDKLEDIKRFPLPQFTPIQKENIISLVDKVITQKRNSQIIDTSTLEKQIDDMVYQLYDLTDEEIAIIEGSINGK